MGSSWDDDEDRRQPSGCGTFIALCGLIGWGALTINWLGDHLVIVIPVCVVLVAGIVALIADRNYTPGG